MAIEGRAVDADAADIGEVGMRLTRYIGAEVLRVVAREQTLFYERVDIRRPTFLCFWRWLDGLDAVLAKVQAGQLT